MSRSRIPTLSVRAGEQVRLVLKNDDPGMQHDFVVSGLGRATKILEDRGQQDSHHLQGAVDAG